jgi:hypothetical protein
VEESRNLSENERKLKDFIEKRRQLEDRER